MILRGCGKGNGVTANRVGWLWHKVGFRLGCLSGSFVDGRTLIVDTKMHTFINGQEKAGCLRGLCPSWQLLSGAK